MQFPVLERKGISLQRIALWIGATLTLVSVGIFVYLGTFTRYLADDYCDTVQATTRPLLAALIQRYLTVSDRYSNLLYDALSERVFPRNVQILPVVMIILWTIALIWLVREIAQLADLRWPLAVDVFLGALLAFFPILEAPSRFQTLYWRSAMATHFAPLVVLTAFAAFLLLMIRRNAGQRPAIWLGVLCLVVAFFAGGFSEPPDAMLVTASIVAMAAIWLWEKGPRRTPALHLLGWTLLGGIIALAVLKFSPAMSFRLAKPPGMAEVAYRTVLYTMQFLTNGIHTVPLPTAVSVVLPAILFYCLFGCAPALSSRQQRHVWLIVAVTPSLMYLMIAASFAPSAYGQAYPVERARFAGCVMMTSAGLLEGACLGTLIAQWRPLHARTWLVNLAALALVVTAIYPLRAAAVSAGEHLSFAQKWTTAWDVRQAQIFADKTKGVQDIVVGQLPGFEQVKELDTNPKFWVNRCAATFYGVRSISAPQMGYLK